MTAWWDVLGLLDGLQNGFWAREEGAMKGFLEGTVDFSMEEYGGVCSELHPTNSYTDEPRAWAPEVEEVELDMMKIRK